MWRGKGSGRPSGTGLALEPFARPGRLVFHRAQHPRRPGKEAKLQKSILQRGLIPGLVLASLLTGAQVSCAWAASKTMTVSLSGASEVPPVQTPGAGKAMLVYDPDTRQLSWTVEFSGLSGPATMAHFHGPAAAGKNGPVALWLVPKGDAPASPVKGQAVLTPEQAKDFTSGEWYVNVHTPANPSGEIRGAIPAVQ
jgi:hypothetical protein